MKGEDMKGKKPQILIIEDEPMFRRILTMLLRRGGYTVLVAETGKEGYALAREHKPDLVLLDLLLPELAGVDVLQKMKADPSIKHIPIVVLSVLRKETYEEKTKKMGAAGYIQKSEIDPNDLADMVKGYL